jgi:hypothetical protein
LNEEISFLSSLDESKAVDISSLSGSAYLRGSDVISATSKAEFAAKMQRSKAVKSTSEKCIAFISSA